MVARVQDSQLREHAHVGALQTQAGLQQGDELIEEAALAVVVDQLLQLVRVHHNVQRRNLRKPELLGVNAREADLRPEGEKTKQRLDKSVG